MSADFSPELKEVLHGFRLMANEVAKHNAKQGIVGRCDPTHKVAQVSGQYIRDHNGEEFGDISQTLYDFVYARGQDIVDSAPPDAQMKLDAAAKIVTAAIMYNQPGLSQLLLQPQVPDQLAQRVIEYLTSHQIQAWDLNECSKWVEHFGLWKWGDAGGRHVSPVDTAVYDSDMDDVTGASSSEIQWAAADPSNTGSLVPAKNLIERAVSSFLEFCNHTDGPDERPLSEHLHEPEVKAYVQQVIQRATSMVDQLYRQNTAHPIRSAHEDSVTTALVYVLAAVFGLDDNCPVFHLDSQWMQWCGDNCDLQVFRAYRREFLRYL